MKYCCDIENEEISKKCIRKSDNKVFKLPRRFSKKKFQGGIHGFTMKSSCAPWKDCIKGGSRKKYAKTFPKLKNINNDLNILNNKLESCSQDPKTGFYRDGYCKTGIDDKGTHTVCAIMDDKFLNFTKKQGNDLSTPNNFYNFPGLKPGDKWCLCEYRWNEAFEKGFAPKVLPQATNSKTKKNITKNILKKV